MNLMELATEKHTKELVTKKYKKRNRMSEILHSIKKNKGAMAGAIILGFLLLVFLGSLFISFETVVARNVSARFTPPGSQYPFGTDSLGRNMLLSVIYGLRYSLAIAWSISTASIARRPASASAR